MLLTKLEKLLFLLRLGPGGLTGVASSEKRFVFVGRSLPAAFGKASIRGGRVVKLADCLKARGFGAVCDRKFGGFSVYLSAGSGG